MDKSYKKKISGYIFKSIEIETKVDDCIIINHKEDDCIITLTVNNNVDEELTNHLGESGRFKLELDIKNEVLYIRYIKRNDAGLNQDYFEAIGLIILVPESVNYKHNKK